MRLDLAVTEAGLADSPQKAQALIMAGKVKVNQETVRRPDRQVDAADTVEIADADGYASRGALKLIPALDSFAIDVTGRVCADIGAATGGFTDVLLRRGARRVFAVDVGRGLIDWRLRGDPRVTLMERTNARELRTFPEPVSLATVDLSFIGLEMVLPALRRAAPEAAVVALFKPQFQVSRDRVEKGGLVRDAEAVEAALGSFIQWCESNGYRVRGRAPAGVAGRAGNQEHFVHLEPGLQP
ncbi:MAG: TlyA family RNA methyltransferase [Chloroflexi bacterium]|nr:MAG: TlyA family RNA methyltransferase [Chloroflexota bacterium]